MFALGGPGVLKLFQSDSVGGSTRFSSSKGLGFMALAFTVVLSKLFSPPPTLFGVL